MSEAAGVNSAAGSFGHSFGLAFAGAIMLATLSVTWSPGHLHDDGRLQCRPQSPHQERVAQALEQDAEVMSNTQLEQLLAGQPEDVKNGIIRINTESRPFALRVALLIPILAALAGLVNSFRMVRISDPPPSESAEKFALG